MQVDPWVRKIPWRSAWQPTLVFLLGKSHGQRSLAGYSPWGHKELDRTEGNLASLVQFSPSIVSDSLQPHEPQHARPPCPLPTPGVYPNSCPLSQ